LECDIINQAKQIVFQSRHWNYLSVMDK